MNTDFSDIRNVIAYCHAHQDALPPESLAFIGKMFRLSQKHGSAFFITVKQRRFLAFCHRAVLEKYPIEKPLSGLARMKQRRDELKKKAWKLGRNNARRRDVVPSAMPTIALSEVLQEYETTARVKHERSQQRAISNFIGTTRSQKPRG